MAALTASDYVYREGKPYQIRELIEGGALRRTGKLNGGYYAEVLDEDDEPTGIIQVSLNVYHQIRKVR